MDFDWYASALDTSARIAVIPVIAKLRTTQSRRSLAKALGDSSEKVCNAAAVSMTRLGTDAHDQMDAVLRAIANPQCDAKDLGLALAAISTSSDDLPARLTPILTNANHLEVGARAIEVIRASQSVHFRSKALVFALLRNPNSSVRGFASDLARGMPMSDTDLAKIRLLLESPDVSPETLDVVAAIGRLARPLSKQLAPLLRPSGTMSAHAVRALTLIGAAEDCDQELLHLLEAPRLDDLVRKYILAAFGSSERLVRAHSEKLGEALADPNFADTALESLALVPAELRKHSSKCVRYLHNDDARAEYRLRLLAGAAPHDDTTILPMLQLAYVDSARASQYRLYAYILAEGRSDDAVYVQWLGRARKDPRATTEAVRRHVLETFLRIWPLTDGLSELRLDIGTHAAEVAAASELNISDAALLKKLILQFEEDHLPAGDRLARMLLVAQLRAYSWRFALFLGLHSVVWMIAFFVYPRSRHVQAAFFWSPWIRKALGLYYVDWLAIQIPSLRNRLLAPFRQRLIEDADDAAVEFDSDDDYFSGSTVQFDELDTAGCHIRASAPLVSTIPQISGIIVLEGDSGLGKSIFLRRLARNAKRLTAYLPAERCAKGVLAALQEKLQGIVSEDAFLQAVVHIGGIDIIIDGLNEVTPDTRANITQFARIHSHLNAILATQPLLEWKPPWRVYQLQPLDDSQISAFLMSRHRAAVAAGDNAIYEQRCATYLEAALDQSQPRELVAAVRAMLSNPMDLTTVANLIAANEHPNLLRLQEQQYSLAAQLFRRAQKRDFPLARFSERVYSMRLGDDASIPYDEFPHEVAALATEKLVFSRDISGAPRRWLFRHDKVMEFFILQAFLGEHNSRPQEHLDDPRFRGVYFLMAMQMPLPAARALRDELVLHAATGRDHSVSDRFVQLLESRKTFRDSGVEWLRRYTLPTERAASVELERLRRVENDTAAQIELVQCTLASSRYVVGMLGERTDAGLLARAGKALEMLGATLTSRDQRTGILVRSSDGRTYAVFGLASTEAICGGDVRDACELALNNEHSLGLPRKLVFVLNAFPDTDPLERPNWITQDASTEIASMGAIAITTNILVEVLNRDPTLEGRGAWFWDRIDEEVGILMLPETCCASTLA